MMENDNISQYNDIIAQMQNFLANNMNQTTPEFTALRNRPYRDVLAQYVTSIRGVLSRTTVSGYQSMLRRYAGWLDGVIVGGAKVDEALDPLVIDRYRATALVADGRPLRPRSIRGALVPLRSFATWLDRQSPARSSYFTDRVQRVALPARDDPDRRAVPEEQVVALLDATRRIRDTRRRLLTRAIVYVIVGTGLRAEAVCQLRITDVDLEQGTIITRRGKGGKSAVLRPAHEVLAAIAEWLGERNRMRCTHDRLWASRPSTGISSDYLRELIADAAHVADLEHEGITPHRLRHSFAQRLAAAGEPITAIRDALLHSRVETTLAYLRTPSDGGATARAGLPAPAKVASPPQAMQPAPQSKFEPEAGRSVSEHTRKRRRLPPK